MQSKRRSRPLPAIGWREWVGLPELGIERLKAKIDTGARSSALHAFDIIAFARDGRDWLRFSVHPYQRSQFLTVVAEAPLVEHRRVRNPGGRTELRPVVRTPLELMGQAWTIDLTLTPRWGMGFRMLLGRAAVRRRFLVDAGRSFLCGAHRDGGSAARRAADDRP